MELGMMKTTVLYLKTTINNECHFSKVDAAIHNLYLINRMAHITEPYSLDHEVERVSDVQIFSPSMNDFLDFLEAKQKHAITEKPLQCEFTCRKIITLTATRI
jgi:hypothetical protein